jgi:putative solute:sodium symporter small subunit
MPQAIGGDPCPPGRATAQAMDHPESKADRAGNVRKTEQPVDARRYWRANQILICVLLAVWAGVSYGCSILLVEPLNALEFKVGTLPLGFWFAQQGSIYVFVLLILVYALAMDRIDRRYGVSQRKGS